LPDHAGQHVRGTAGWERNDQPNRLVRIGGTRLIANWRERRDGTAAKASENAIEFTFSTDTIRVSGLDHWPDAMLITRAQLYPLEVPMSKPIKMAGETLTHAQTLLLRLIDEQGREGWGEASAAPLMTGETLGSITASTGYLVSKLIGVRVTDPSAITPLQDNVLYGNASAKSCHETALMDLFAQRHGLPMYRLLAGDIGGRFRPAGNAAYACLR
jgi:hypothetical protein